MKDKIIKHIIETKNPDAIILHGSRARHKEQEHSDWDIVLLYNQETEVKNGREFLDEQNIEYSVRVLPIHDVYKNFEAK